APPPARAPRPPPPHQAPPPPARPPPRPPQAHDPPGTAASLPLPRPSHQLPLGRPAQRTPHLRLRTGRTGYRPNNNGMSADRNAPLLGTDGVTTSFDIH